MWDDSYDSVPSPMIPKGKSGRNNTGYDGFDNKKGFQKSDQREIDALFSPDNSAPASENNSPDEKFANRKYQDPYAFNEPPKSDNYLANFATNSGDLEDSILGELLGMPKKTPSAPAVNASKPDSTTNSSTFPSSNKIEKGGRKLSPAGKLEPLDTNVAKSPRSASSPIIPNKSTKDPFGKQPINRFSNDGPITSMKSFEFEQNRGVSVDSNTGLTSGGVGGGGRAHFNSFDVTGSNDDYDSSQDDKNEYLPSKPSGYHPTKVDSSVANKRTVTMKNDYQSSNTMGIASAVSYDSVNTEEKPTGNVGSKSNTYNFSAPSLASTSEGEKKKEDEDNNANLGFIPSFLDPSRQGRRRRGGDEGPRSSGGLRGSSDARGGGSKLDELDAALGLATPLAGPTTGNKKPVDPFAAAEKKIPSLPTAAAGKKSTILGDSDSSSDDDLLKPKSRFSITTPKFGKPETTTSTQNPPATNKSVTTFSDSRKESKDTSIPPVADPVPAPSASNAASSHSTGSAAMNAAKTNLPALGIGSPTNSSVVKLPSPEHKSASFSVKFSRSRDEQEKEKNKLRGSTGSGIDSGHDFGVESDELDISGIVKANDDELARFGLKDSTSTSYGKDKKQKETLKDTHKEKEKDYKDKEKEKEGLASPTQTGIQLSRKSVGNIRPNVSPLTGKPAGSSSTYGNELKSPLSSGQMKMMNLSSSMDDETSPRPGFNNTNLGSRSKEYSSGVDKKDMYSSLLSNSSDGLNVGKNNTTAPLPISPKKPSHRTSERDRAPTITLPADQHDGKIDEILEQTKQQKEKNEKEMLSEIESLKNKLYHLESQSITRSNAALGGGGVGGNNFDLENENRILMEQNQRLLNEQLQSKRIISQLEIEVIRLKDEINLQQSKHLTDYRQLNEKHDGEVKEIQLKHELDIETIEKRHSEVIQAMKEIHQQEIQSYKDRTKSTDQFDNMMKLIHQTTGSMKYLEEQLSVKHQSIQHVQKSHLDSREKQLMDLEEKAKDRIELVELEEYKLKGILLHMETLMNSLRSQNLEEKERLQSEHQRLSILQTSLINEKVNFQQQITSEYALLKEKQKEFEYKQLENEKLKLQSFEEINHQQHQLELMKREIETERLVIKKSYEQKERFLQDEEKRLLRQQEEMMNEKLLFQQYKQSCEQELTVLEDSKKLLKKAIEQLTIEKEEVYYQSKQVNIQLQHNHEKEEELKQLQENLLLKENIINHSFQEMKIAANELTLQEKQLHSYLSEMEGKKRDLVNMDQSLLEKKLIYFQQFRDTLLNNVIDQQQYQSQLVLPPPPSASPSLLNKENQPNHLMTGQQGREAQFNMMPNTLGIYQTKSTDIDDGMQPISSSFSAPSNPNIVPGLTSTGYAMSSPSKGVSSNTYHNQGNDWTSQFKQKMQLAYAGNHHPERLLPKEIQSAQKLLKENRSFLQKHSNIEIRKFLNQEESFVTNLERLQRHQQKEGGEGGNNIYRK